MARRPGHGWAMWRLSLVLLLPQLAAAQAQDFIYSTNGGTVTINSYTGLGGDAIIPGTTEGLPVIGIGMNASYSRTSVTNITLPDSVN